jgi:very-short-patch-repair endonuclease
VHIRRQHVLLGRFIPDFYCAHAGLCIEIDGDSHAEPAQAAYDAERTACLEEHGYRVIRFTNAEVLSSLPSVLEVIAQECRGGRPVRPRKA